MTGSAMLGPNRREFLAAAGTAVAASVVAPARAARAAANERLQLGIIGCGGRGIWLGNLFQQHSDTKVVAVHDYFQDRVDLAGARLEVPAERRHVGLEGFRALLASDVDAVAIISPPYFHPEQFVAAVDAGKHAFLAKPIAVDVWGCQTIRDAARRHAGRLSMLVDFQTRNDPLFRQAAQHVHEGMIGDPVSGQAYYVASRLNIRMAPGTEVARLRNWMFDKALSGDIIVEQNIHVLDVANWYLQGHPVSAWGTGGRKARVDVGDAWDHFLVAYTYPNEVLIDFSSAQFTQGYDDLCTRIYGNAGTVDSHYGGQVIIHNREGGWRGGVTDQIYQQGAVNNLKDFHASIVSGAYLNNIDESADSTLTSILGRMAAYGKREVTWDEMMASNERLDAGLALPEDGPGIPAST
jgi:myo-inositol 2-dehydrogenase / D-chiro-inositol 1-dehydrogenase